MTQGPPLPYFYRLLLPTGFEELADLELRALAGETEVWHPCPGAGADRIRWARAGADVSRAALVGEACRLLAWASDLEGLLGAAAKLGLAGDRFRITVHGPGGARWPGARQVTVALADLVEGGADLERPLREYVVAAEPGRWLLGELVSRCGGGWRGHDQRLHQYSAALPSRLARALVNLVARPGDRLLDPCCGVGTVLVEAAAVGVRATGREVNRLLVEHARANLRYWSLEADVAAGDGRQAAGCFDGAVLDLPYGRSAERVEGVCRGLIEQAAVCADLLAVVSATEMTRVMQRAGLAVLGLARVPKGGLVRHVHWLRSTHAG